MEPGDFRGTSQNPARGPERGRWVSACHQDWIKTVLVFHGLRSVWVLSPNRSAAPLYCTEGFSEDAEFQLFIMMFRHSTCPSHCLYSSLLHPKELFKT